MASGGSAGQARLRQTANSGSGCSGSCQARRARPPHGPRLAGAAVVIEPRRGYVCRVGVDAARPNAETVVFLDGHGSNRSKRMRRPVQPIADDRFQFVVGSRARGSRKLGSISSHQIAARRLRGAAVKPLYGIDYSDRRPFRPIRRSTLERLPMREETYGGHVGMQTQAAQARLRVPEIPVDRRRRLGGGEPKVSGNFKGTLKASACITQRLARVALDCLASGPSPRFGGRRFARGKVQRHVTAAPIVPPEARFRLRSIARGAQDGSGA